MIKAIPIPNLNKREARASKFSKKFFNLEKLHNYLQNKDKVEFIVRRIEYFDSTRYVVDVTKVIEIEEVSFLKF